MSMSEWIEWKGGKRPVEAETLVEAKLRNGRIIPPASANEFFWDDMNRGGDIIAYRIIKEVEE